MVPADAVTDVQSAIPEALRIGEIVPGTGRAVELSGI
jgi:hypothetical protein